MPIDSELFGTLPTGEPVNLHTLTNTHGLQTKIIDYGGIITELHAPDRKGNTVDVVLGFDRLDDYLEPHPHFGALIGRVAGRTTHGAFTLEGKDYRLAINDPPNHLHGGNQGFGMRLWMPRTFVNDRGEPTLVLKYCSPDGEEGYPGNLDVTVTHTLTNDNALRLDYEAVTDRATPFSPTNHSYFNLAGEGSGDVSGQVLQLFCEEYVPTDEDMTLSGRRKPVAGGANDFIRPRILGNAIPGLFKQHGDNYLVPGGGGPALVPVARLEDPAGGRVMEVSTTETCLQFYTAASLDGMWTGKSGRPYNKHAAVCLECQGYPDGVMQPAFGNIVLHPGITYRQSTEFRFSTTV